MFKLLSENAKKLFLAGIFLIVLASIGIWIGNSYEAIPYSGDNRFLKQLGFTYQYPYNYLISPSMITGLIGLSALCPAILKLTKQILKNIWQLVMRAIYNVFYEATKAMEDAKRKTEK